MHGSWVSLVLVAFLMACGSRLAQEPVSVEGERARILKSQRDAQDRYPFTVRVSADNGLCSGVLISAHLVLTAAHCFCRGREGAQGEVVMDASDCADAATVETVLYENAEEDEALGITAQYEGKVKIHSRFKLVEGGEHPLKSIQADLALIRLNQGIGNIRTASWQGRSAVKKGEFLFMVGYGYFETDRQRMGERRFGPNSVTAVDGEKFQFGKPGSHLMPADSGGACVRETSHGPELVGVMVSGGAPSKNSSTCMNTYSPPVQDWLKQELKLAGDAS